MSQNIATAATQNISSILTAQGYRQVNNGEWGYVTFFNNSTIPATLYTSSPGAQAYALQALNISANVPSGQSGKYIQATVTGSLGYNYGNFSTMNCSGLTGYIRPENVDILSYNDGITCDVSPDGTILYFQIYSYIELDAESTPTTFYFNLDNPSNFLFTCSDYISAMSPPCSDNSSLRLTSLSVDWSNNRDPNVALLEQQIQQNQTIINQNQTIIDQNDYMAQNDEEYYDRHYEAENNISNQNANDIDGSTNPQTTSLINVISGFISAFSNINATNCNMNLELPDFAGGSRVVNICSGKEKAPQIIEIGSSLLLICVFVPLAFVVIRMIYNEIRSWTNG